MAKKNIDVCSFCGKTREEVGLLIKGINAEICDLCGTSVHQIITEANQPLTESKEIHHETTFPKPKEIKTFLDDYIVGQEDAKKALSISVYNHYKRLLFSKKESTSVEVEKSNLLLIGETGSGKTLLAQTIAKMVNVPFCIADATALTQAGYVGEDVESIISRLLQVADYDVNAAERGIIFIDEIDKVGRKNDNPSVTRDVSGEGVQQALLKLLEGTIANVAPEGGRKHPEQPFLQVNTKNILFICGGSFEGLEGIIESRLNKNSIGFNRGKETSKLEEKSIFEHITPRDLKQYGLIPELIGRIPSIASTKSIDKKNLKRILLEPKNALVKQYKKLFEYEGIVFDFDEKVIDYIVDEALRMKLGARGLRTVCEKIMTDIMFELPSSKKKTYILDMKAVKKKLAS